MFINRISSDSYSNKNLPLLWCNSFLWNAVNEPSLWGHKFFMRKISSETFLGKTFNHWTIIRDIESDDKNKLRMVEARCVCGKVSNQRLQNIMRGLSKSCGCKKLEAFLKSRGTHGLSRSTRIYRIYIGMKVRCYKEDSKPYKYYGAKNVKICDEWLNDFMAFYNWSMANGYDDKLTIDRYPNKKGNYEPSNCRWATRKKQQRNQSGNREITFNGETKIMIEWAEYLNISPKVISERLRHKWSVERTLTEPVHSKTIKKVF